MITRSPSQKFIPPHFPSNALHRDTLVQTLQEVICPLISTNDAPLPRVVLLCAPAGYGKTTLLADFVQSVAIPCCWYHLEPEDMDVYTFLSNLVESIRQRFPHIGKTLIDSLKQLFSGDVLSHKEAPNLKEFINTLLLEIDSSIFERFAIFFCNYHEVNESDEISALVNWMIKRLPEQCIVGIESRAIPALDLISMLSQRMLFGLGSNDLRFTPEDIYHLARQQKLELSLEEATELHYSFDGWIAGILLGTRLGEKFFSPALGSGMSWSVPTLRMDRQTLLAYLVDRVFKQELEIYTFLQETSLFPHLTSELCDRLMERTDTAAYLASIEHQGFFLTHTEDQHQVIYTCHPILRELLYQELRQEAPQRFLSLHQRAAQIFYEMTEYEQSITHALTAESYHLAASTLAEIAKRLVQQGRSNTVARWIDQLPADIQQHYPALMLARAYIYTAQGETDKALLLLDQLHLLICPNKVQADDSIATLLAEICIIRSVVAYNMGNYAEVQSLCEKALKLLPADERELRAHAYQRLGVYANFLGDSSTGIAQMQKALQLWGHNTEALQTALLHGNLATAYSMAGNYALAEHHRSRAITTYDRLGDIQGKINSMVGMAITKRNKGALDEAEKRLQEALALARLVHFQRGEAYVLANLGNVYQDQGRLQEALVASEDCLNLAHQLQDKYLMNLATNTFAMTYLFMGDPQTALFHIGTTDIQAKETMNYEWMVLELTRGTILLHLQQYAEALACLLAVQNAFNKAQFKNLYISSLIRLAMCQLALNQQEEALSLVRQAELLAARENCEHLVQLELSRLPVLQYDLQHQPAPVVQVSVPTRKPTSLRAVALGEPAIFIDEVPITRWRMARSLELYFFLIDYGRPVRKEQILTALWHDVDDNSDQTLRSAIYYLRKTIGDACIPYHAGAYNLNHTSVYGEQVQYDVNLFLTQFQEAKNALVLEHNTDAESALLLMMDLYQGDYVQPFYSDWCSHRRDELRRIYMDARRNLALLTWREERLEECIVHWQHLLAIDNCQEDAHYGLMRCYARQGKRGLALRQYQRCTEILHEEFAVLPRPSLQKLYQHLSGNE